MGLASALVFANLGAAYGTAKSGVGICSIGVLRNDLIFKSLIPGIMAGILGIYGLIVAVIYQGRSKYLTFISEKLAEKGRFLKDG
jgi:V-type H+-transporting ATPase proteolipid subunit